MKLTVLLLSLLATSANAKDNRYNEAVPAIHDTLLTVSESTNDVLPMPINEHIDLINTDVQGNVFIFSNKINHVVPRLASIDDIQAMFQSELIEAICKSPSMLVMTENEVLFEYQYEDKRGRHLGSVFVDSAEC